MEAKYGSSKKIKWRNIMENNDKQPFELKLEKVKFNVEIIPPISKVVNTLSIKNNINVELEIASLEIDITVAGVKTPLKAENINVKPTEKMTIEIERHLDIFETVNTLIRINEDYTIIGKAKINNEDIELKIKGEIGH